MPGKAGGPQSHQAIQLQAGVQCKLQSFPTLLGLPPQFSGGAASYECLRSLQHRTRVLTKNLRVLMRMVESLMNPYEKMNRVPYIKTKRPS